MTAGTPGSPWLFVSEDPDRTFALVGPGVLYWFNHAAKLAQSNNVTNAGIEPIESVDELRARGMITILTPDEMVTKIRAMVGDLRVDTFGIRIAPPGVPVAGLTDHLELFATKVMPHFA
jgi:hypothetical protein